MKKKPRKTYGRSQAMKDRMDFQCLENDIYFLKLHLGYAKDDIQTLKNIVETKQFRAQKGWNLEAAATDIQELRKRISIIEQAHCPEPQKKISSSFFKHKCLLTPKEKVKQANKMLKMLKKLSK